MHISCPGAEISVPARQIWSSIEYVGQYAHYDVFLSIPGQTRMSSHLQMWLVGNVVFCMRNMGMG